MFVILAYLLEYTRENVLRYDQAIGLFVITCVSRYLISLMSDLHHRRAEGLFVFLAKIVYHLFLLLEHLFGLDPRPEIKNLSVEFKTSKIASA